MRILRDRDAVCIREHVDCKVYDCKIYVRSDFIVASASEWFYGFVGEYSYLPFTEFICPEDAQILRDSLDKLTEPVEVYTWLTNRTDGSSRNVYLRMENCDKTDGGKPLYLVTLIDILDIEKRAMDLEANIAKYRHFLTLKDEYYFEYVPSTNKLKIYTYVNLKSIKMAEGDIDGFVDEYAKEHEHKDHLAQLHTFCDYLKGRTNSFETELILELQGTVMHFGVKGGTFYRDNDLVSGVMTPNGESGKTAYYLTPAARDAGTGLLNKKAVTEYAVEKMHTNPGHTMWLIIMDIDDFKNINDSFGHLFGDEVIKKVAETVQINVGYRGTVGRFGGDEFFAFVDGIETREELKTLLKTIVKELLIAFDKKIKITASIGVSRYPKDGESFDILFGKADKALYIAKEKGKNRHIIYDEAIHGAYTEDSVQVQSVAYVVSRDKRRKSLVELMSNINKNGAQYVTDNEEELKRIRNLFDLDGITIYTDFGERVLCRNGAYMCEASDRAELFEDKKYKALFEEDDVFVASNIAKMKSVSDTVYRDAAKQEIGACIRCVARLEDKPFVMIDFDIFNCNRKWSDNDIEMLSLIGCCLGRMICER